MKLRSVGVLFVLSTFALFGCATPPDDRPMPAQGFAEAPREDGLLADVESALRERSQPNQSGFLLLNSNEQGLRWRLALIDSARHSIDLQYYVWWGDESGDLLMQRVIEAANRGVKVRLILDDLSTMLEDEAHPKLRDLPTAVIDSHPNIEVRLFNAWRHRAISGRVIETFERLERINHRMHNKLLVVDNRATIVGGRNIGNEYFGLSPTFNFRDLDVLGVGPVARQASGVFDRFWNSHWVMEVAVLGIQVPPGALQGHEESLEARLLVASDLALFLQEPDEREELVMALPSRLHLGSSRVHTDTPDADAVSHHMPEAIRALIGSAQDEVLITNAYVIPDRLFLDQLAEQARNGVRLRLLTNSLASHDVPAVNSHYKQWRRPLLEAGVELFELRHDAALKSSLADTAPNEGEFVGLHVKAAVIDRERVFIGSMNLDPRSQNINSEMGVVIESPTLARELAEAMEHDMGPKNAWRVAIAGDGRLHWRAMEQERTHQPARNVWQRVQDMIFMAFPRDLY